MTAESVRAEGCGCVVTVSPGHTHTKMCETHRAEYFSSRGAIIIINHQRVERNNLDLIS